MILLPLLLACGPKAPPPVVLDGPDAVTEEALNALVAELVPIVEEEAGRSFERVPHARLGRRADLEAILEHEFLLITGAMFDAPEWAVQRLARQARASAPGVVGKYGIETGVLYLSPEAVAGTASQLEEGRYGDVARLVMAHEMVHALQSEVMSWEDLAPGFRDMDQLDAVRGVTEGHANFVERRIAERLGLLDVQDAMNRSQGWTEDGPVHPAAFELWALYGQGMGFVGHHHAEGGHERVWTLIRRPPASTSMLFRPSTYAPEAPPTPDWSAVTAGVASELTDGHWTSVTGQVGELALRQELFGRDEERVDTVLAALRQGFAEDAMRPDRAGSVRILRFDDTASAGRYVDLALADPNPDLAAIPDEEARAALQVAQEALRSEIEPLEGVEADRAVKRVTGPRGMVRAETHEAWVVRGDTVFVVQASGFRPGLRLRRAVDRLLRQWAERGGG